MVCVCVLLTTAAWGNILNFSFDENGNNAYIVKDDLGNTLQTGSVGHGVKADDSGNTNCPILTLFYGGLPGESDASDGDIKIMEPGTTTISDVLRFAGGTLYVYSDLPEVGELPPFDLADNGIPTDGSDQWQSTVISFNEEGTENGWNGLHYTAGVGDPGFIEGYSSVSYVFTSDVPEPGTLVMLLGLVGMFALGYLRRK